MANTQIRVFGVYMALTVWSILPAYSQNKNNEKSALVTGRVCDSENRAIENATVSLDSDDHTHTITFQSDSQGRYRFAEVPIGSYQLRANKSGYGIAKSGPFILHAAESKSIELRLLAEAATASGGDNPAAVRFSDEIHFNV